MKKLHKLLLTTTAIVSIFGWNIHVYANQNTNADVNTLKVDPAMIEPWLHLPKDPSDTTEIDPFENPLRWSQTVPIGTKIHREIKRNGEVCNETVERTNDDNGYNIRICCSSISTDRLAYSYSYSCSSGSSGITIIKKKEN